MKIDRMNKGSWGKVLAFFDVVTDEGFTIKGFKIVQSPDGGFFVGFPSAKDKDDEYKNTVFASKELKAELDVLAHNTYNEGDPQSVQPPSGGDGSSEEIPY
jgi:DNA-binding cell septation regulator SpoVG